LSYISIVDTNTMYSSIIHPSVTV